MNNPTHLNENPWGSGATQHFFNLTPEHVLTAVEKQGFVCTGRTLALGSMENRVYEVEIELPEGTKLRSPSDRFVVVKFYRPGRWSKETIQDEHDFLNDLIESDIPVIAPLANQDHQTLHQEVETGLLYTIFPKKGGRSPDELSDEDITRVGRLLARLHGVGSTKKAIHRVVLSPESYGLNNLAWLIDSKTLPIDVTSRFQTVVESICKLSEPWFREAPIQRIHGDCHLGNLLWSSEGPFWVDFDDMVMGPPIQDLWLMIPGRDDWAQAKMRKLLDGYRQLRDFDAKSIRLIEPLRALRFVHFAAWIGKRWEDPSFPRGFPQYGSDRYWAELLRDLEDQLIQCKSNIWH